MALVNATLTTSAAAIYTCSNADGSAVKGVTFTNYSGSAVTASLYACPAGEAAADENLILKDLPLDAGASYNYTEAQLLFSNTDVLRAIASANSAVAVTVSYFNV